MIPASQAKHPGRSWPAGALLLLFPVASLLLAPVRAGAQPAAVEDLIREGVELRKQSKDHLALPLFQKAYDLERSGRSAGQLGLAEASLGYWMSAERHLIESLSASRNPWVARNEAELRRTLQAVQASIGELEVTGSPSGAEVTVNGQMVGRLPLARLVRVPEGAAQVSMSAAGHRTGSTSALVEGGKRSRVTLVLERQESAAPAGPPAVAARRAPAVDPAAEEEAASERQPAHDEGSTAWVRPASWFAAAGAVAALAVGTYGLTAQHSRVDEFDSYTPPGMKDNRPCNVQTADKGGEGCQAIFKRIESAEKLAVGGFVVGGVLAAAAIVGFVYSSGSSSESEGGDTRESDVALSIDPGNPATGAPFQLRLALRF